MPNVTKFFIQLVKDYPNTLLRVCKFNLLVVRIISRE